MRKLQLMEMSLQLPSQWKTC